MQELNISIWRRKRDPRRKQRNFWKNIGTDITLQNPKKIRESLDLMPFDQDGNSIKWKSSNQNVIKNSGRVVRPHWDSADESVTLTAEINGSTSVDFDFIVKADEKPCDPMRMPDKSFFGEFCGGKIKTPSVLNYEDKNLESVKSAVKNGDYISAKEALFQYMKNRPKQNIILPERRTEWVDYLAAGMCDMQRGSQFITSSKVESIEYRQVTIQIDKPEIKTSESKSFRIISKYNDSVEIDIASNYHPDETLHPRFVMNVNGYKRTYKAKLTSFVRAGQWADRGMRCSESLKVKLFGSFLGDETYNAIIQFDFDDILESDIISDCELVIHAKKSTDYSEDKEFFLLRDLNLNWDEFNVGWNDLTTTAHNFSGLAGGPTWQKVPHADVEYLYQSCRFMGYPEMLAEYLHTGNEDYLYCIISRMMDFTVDCSASWPRTLDTACRIENWLLVFDGILESKYMDADICTALLKAIYQSVTECLMVSKATTANWIQIEKLATYQVMSVFSEFALSKQIRSDIQNHFAKTIDNDFYPDGSYIENTEGYNLDAYLRYVNVKKEIIKSGGKVSEAYDNIIKNGAYAALMLRGPAGECMGFGDQGHSGPNPAQYMQDVVEWFNDPELQYIDTFGKNGTEPSWTSKLFPDASYCIMRSDWTKDSLSLYTNVRGGGAHGHYDDNGLILYAYGKNLLVDAGWVTYTDCPDRRKALSTINHSTVEINGTDQKSPYEYTKKYENIGITHFWETTSFCDVLSQSTKRYQVIGNSHRRTITFIKPELWVISDLCIPMDLSENNVYKQAWHTPVDSDAVFDVSGNRISTSYKNGPNLIVLNVDDNAVLKKGNGIYSTGYGAPIDNPFGYFEKSGCGYTTFDTILFPYNGIASLKAERIALDISMVTMLKITVEKNSVLSVYYYLLNMNEMRSPIKFRKGVTDAQIAVLKENEYGEILDTYIFNGSYIQEDEK